MRQCRISIDVAAPPDRVFAVISDVEHWHEWTPSVTSIKRFGTGPFAIGRRLLIRQPKFPPAMWKVTGIEPGRGFTSVSPGPGLRVVAQHWVEPAAAGSRATLSIDLQGVLGGMFGKMRAGITNRYLKMEADGLKARSENPAFRHGASPRARA